MTSNDPRARRVERIAQHARTLDGAIQLLSVVIPPGDLLALNQNVRRITTAAEGLVREPTAVGAPGLDHFEEELVRIERDLAALDLAVPMERFRPLIEDNTIPPIFLVRYARLMGSRELGIGIRRDRFEFVINRILLHGQPRPPYEVASKDKLQRLLAEISPAPGHMDEKKLADTIRVFTEVEARIEACASFDELIESAVYMDFRGYKLSLRNELLNHDVLYAVARVDVLLANRLASFAANDATVASRIRFRLSEQQEEVDRVFGVPTWEEEVKTIKREAQQLQDRARRARDAREDRSDDTQARVRAIVLDDKSSEDRERKERDRKEREKKERERREPTIAPAVMDSTPTIPLWLIGVAILVFAGAGAAYFVFGHKRSAQLTAPEVAAISSNLASAEVTSSAGKRIINAQMSADYQQKLPDDQATDRDEVAAAIQRAGIREGFVRTGNTVIMEFVDGKRIDFVGGEAPSPARGRGKRGFE